MIILIDTGKVNDKIQYLFTIGLSEKQGIEGEHVHMIKSPGKNSLLTYYK